MSSSNDQCDEFFNSDTLNDDFFAEIVQKKLNITRDSFKISLVLISPATGKNENYASVVYRAKIKIQLLATSESKIVDVIVKASLLNMPELKEFGVFPRERFMYESVLTSFEKIWFEKSGEEIEFGPQGIKFVTDPYEIIVLDDLKASGYVMLDRKEGLTLEQGKLLLTKLAKFHAISALRYQKEGVLHNCLDRASNPVDPNAEFVQGFIRMFVELIKALERYGDCDIYVEKLKKFDQQAAVNFFLNDHSPLKCGLKVLIHGDLWVNNVMFKVDENTGETTDVRLIDFQMGFWTNPIIDVLSIILTSIHDDIMSKYFDELIDTYHQELSGALKIVGYTENIPSLSEFHNDIMENNVLAAIIPSYLFFVKYSIDEAINLEALMSETDEEILDAMYQKIYKCPVLEKSMRILLPLLNERGLLDVKASKSETNNEK